MKTLPEPANSSQPHSVQQESKAPPRKRWLPHGFGRWMLAGVIVLILIGLVLPITNSSCVQGRGTRELAQAKQIGLALRLFAGDHDGNYPRAGYPPEMQKLPRYANEAFATLFPTYCQSEKIFGSPYSAYQSGTGGDNKIDSSYTGPPVETLRPGENIYGYIVGLTDASDPNAPLVVDGTDGDGHYNVDHERRGGAWGKGRKAVVIRVDNSGAIENLVGPDNALFIPRPEPPHANLLDDLGRYGKDVRLLDPAAPAAKVQ